MNKSMRITKNVQDDKNKIAKVEQSLNATVAKWHAAADKIIKLQDTFKAAEKRGDAAKQLELKKEIDKLHPGAEKLRLTVKNTLKKLHGSLVATDRVIEQEATEIVKLAKSNPHRGGGQSAT